MLATVCDTETVHPHTRGEHTIWCGERAWGTGSSPHAWGTLSLSHAVPPFARFIPTRVGNTRLPRRPRPGDAVHPHTRGEHALIVERLVVDAGSSPHAWGTRDTNTPAGRVERFIPTRVGNTSLRFRPQVRAPVHPHTRGEHGLADHASPFHRGSSPHAWGTHPDPCRHSPRSRFIPTRVGNTCPIAATVRAHPVHPHTRGEHRQAPLESPCVAGSSPHAWGTLL